MLREENKEYYRLWYEYLKKNEDYKAFWDRVPSRKPLKRRDLLDFPENVDPEVFRGPNSFSLMRVSIVWRNIYDSQYSFDKWWRRAKKLDGVSKNAMRLYPPVRLAGHEILEEMESFIRLHEKHDERGATARELRDYFASYFRGAEGRLALVIVEMSENSSLAELVNNFRTIVRHQLSANNNLPQFPDFSTKPKLPRLYQLKRYLFEWELRKERKLKYREIIKKVSEEIPDMKHWEGKEKDSGVERTLKADINKAQRIINNTISNVFPGIYDFTRKSDQALNGPDLDNQ